VTRVIETATRALAAAGLAPVVLVGEEPPPGAGPPVRVVAGLGYRREAGALSAAELAGALRDAAVAALGAPPDIWHFHNHALGKNVLLADVVALLAEAGERLVLQLHDLAEDGRPANYALIANSRCLYPVGPAIRYAFVNSRDLARFRQCGLPAENAIFLPNAVTATRSGPTGTTGPPLVLYPVRGIRRKNLGEVVLLAALAPAGVRFAVTGAPTEPQWRGIHEAWRDFAREHGLPVEFAVVDRLVPVAGAATSFAAWLEQATHLLTTSVAEGFGFAFLDAVALGKPLLGRNLPHLTADHAAQGLRYGSLYDRVLVPVEVIGLAALEAALRESLTATYRGYGREVSAAEVARARTAIVGDGWVDFGNLPETLQRVIVIKLLADPGAFELWLDLAGERVAPAAWLADRLGRFHSGGGGKSAGLEPWSAANNQARLLTVYDTLSRQPAAPVRYLDPSRMLDLCLTPETFHFLRGW
jgi:glycosyltransferase involved in cell wall biosynthesis